MNAVCPSLCLHIGCWKHMDSLAEPWVAFLNQFADALHKHDMILSVFIDGCCGYTNRSS